jgi:hypothetical protein
MTLITISYYNESLLSIVHSLDHDPGDWDGRGHKPQRLQRLRVALRLIMGFTPETSSSPEGQAGAKGSRTRLYANRYRRTLCA